MNRSIVFLAAVVLAQLAPAQPSTLCLKPDESPLWKTACSAPVAFSICWPARAVKAEITVDDGVGPARTETITDLSVTSWTFAEALPAEPVKERVVTATLTFRDVAGDIVGEQEQARFGFVYGGGDGTALVASPDSPDFVDVAREAVFPVPPGTTSITIDSQDVSDFDSPGWIAVSLPQSDSGRLIPVSLTDAEGTWTGEIRRVAPGFLMLLQ